MSEKVGNSEHARQAMKIWASNVWDSHPDYKYLNSGLSRYAFLHIPTQIVYKVGTRWAAQCNRQEVSNIKRLRQNPLPGWEIPDADLYTIDGAPVVAMPYIPKDSGSYYGEWGSRERRRAQAHFGLCDLHSDNVHTHNGIHYIIDVAD